MSINQHQLKATRDSSAEYVNVKTGIKCHKITATFRELLVIVLISQRESGCAQFYFHLRGQVQHTVYCHVYILPTTISSHGKAIIYRVEFTKNVNQYL